MSALPGSDTAVRYSERLWPPVSWWIVTALLSAMTAAMVYPVWEFGALVVPIVVFVLAAAWLRSMSSPVVVTGDALIARIARLKEIGAITRFGPFFDAAAMGGAFCLCAMAVPAERWDEVVTKVNARPEVAHNYERSHALNMWFVLATDTPDGIDRTARAIEDETGLKVMLFPKLEEYFIGFRVQA